MSVSRPLLLGLGGLALLGVVQWVILPAFEYRADNASRAERARQRHLSMQLLTDDYARLSQSNAAAPAKNRSLFSLVNKEADRLSLSRRIEALRPAARKENDGSERIEMRLTGLYLKQGVAARAGIAPRRPRRKPHVPALGQESPGYGHDRFPFRRHAMNRGFTLLEVLIALAILSTVALLAVRVSGDSLTQLAETGWEDGVLRAGRGKMIQMLRESPDSLDQWGTLSPEYPDVEWHSKLIALRCMEGKRLEFRLVENRGTSSRELLLEYILPR